MCAFIRVKFKYCAHARISAKMTSSLEASSDDVQNRLSEEFVRDAEEQREVTDHVEVRDEDAPDTLESGEDEVDLKKMADDYAKYLIVNSKQDVRYN